MGMSSDNVHGLVLAVSSSVFIGSCFIIKKKGLIKAGSDGVRTVNFGEVANFAAYAFAPAIIVTPLGALSIIFSAVLAHFILNEKLHIFGVLGCILCVVGSTVIVMHAPHEKAIESVKQVWQLATKPVFLVYGGLVVIMVVILIFYHVPRYGHTHLIVYVGICSLMGSLTVMCVKAVSITVKLSFEGSNQFIYFQTWFFTAVVICCLLQINYLNKALDVFNTAVVSPVYYVIFTSFTILASMIMFKDWDNQNSSQIATELWFCDYSLGHLPPAQDKGHGKQFQEIHALRNPSQHRSSTSKSGLLMNSSISAFLRERAAQMLFLRSLVSNLHSEIVKRAGILQEGRVSVAE